MLTAATRLLLLTALLLLLGREAYAQSVVESEAARELPQEIIDAIERSGEIQRIYPVVGSEMFDGQILSADQIVFSEGASLTFSNSNFPWLLIYSNSIKFASPDVYSRIGIRRPSIGEPAQAAAGSNGASGSTGGKDGSNGNAGGNGSIGTKGFSPVMPHLYIVTREILSPDGIPPFVSLAIMGGGFEGGRGGKGGIGGNGGSGGSGRGASTGVIDCRRGGGDGGNGGNAGLGGMGGQGGDGSSGLSLTFVSNRSAADIFSYVRVQNQGGFGGRGGQPGNAGREGGGGNRGRGTGNCGGGSSGSSGAVPNPSSLGYGVEGSDGIKGDFKIVIANDIDSLFD